MKIEQPEIGVGLSKNLDGRLIRHEKILFDMQKTCKHFKIVKQTYERTTRYTYCIRCMRRLRHDESKKYYIDDRTLTGIYNVTVPELLGNRAKVLRNV